VIKARVLLVEDSEHDVMLTKVAFEMNGIDAELFSVCDGVLAIEYLNKRGPYKGIPSPDFVLLDLNMPRLDGRRVLREIRNDPYLKDLPVFIMTTSSSEKDITEAYANCANLYIVKPLDLHEFINSIRNVYMFWKNVIRRGLKTA
jgi:two-component system response regulator